MNPLLARFHDEMVLFDPEKKAHIESLLEEASKGFGGKSFQEVISAAANDDTFWGEPGSFLSQIRPYTVVDGILQIPVKGVLLNDFPYAFGSYATGYQYIIKAFERGLRDGSVRGVAFMIHSPGGEVAGNFYLVDKLYEYRGQKPVRAFAHEYAYSAAYSIATAADEIWVSKTGGVGSIGVLTSHVSYEEAYKQMGIEITYIHAGKHKVDGNATKKLPEDVKARIQTKIDALYDLFVSTVARNREMEEKAVRDTEALTFMATEAVENGLADHIGSVEDATNAFVAFLDSEDEQMANRTPGETAAYNEGVSYGQTTADTANAAKIETAKTEAATAAVKGERERVKSILALDEGKDRPSAVRFALKSGMSADDAKEYLSDAPVEKTTAVVKTDTDADADTSKGGKGGFEKAMDASQHPEAGADAAGGSTKDAEPGALGRSMADQIYGKRKNAA